jgi:cobalt/nickel transport system permease protein
MHLPDVFVSPAAGIAFNAVGGAFAVAAALRTARSGEMQRRLPIMAALGALAFAIQMIRFPLPWTGGSAHLVGGLLVAILLGPDAVILVMLPVLVIQALVFAQGGLVALGANLFGTAIFPAWIGFPLYRRLAGASATPARSALAAVLAAVVSMEIGAVAVVLLVSAAEPGVDAMRLVRIVSGIHVPIAIAEGLATAALLAGVRRLLRDERTQGEVSGTAVLAVLGVALFASAVLADFASNRPEWPMWAAAEVSAPTVATPSIADRVHVFQRRIALLPDYDLPGPNRGSFWPEGAAVSVAGLFGALTCALLVLASGLVSLPLERMLRPRDSSPPLP